jgi:hypothetical protein
VLETGTRGLFRKTKAPEPGERFAAGRCQQRRRHEAVSSAVGVSDPQTRRNLSVDTQPTAMQGAMVGAAQDHQIVRIIASVFRAQIQVVQIDVSRIAASRNDAAAPIAPEDFPANRRWRVLCRALSFLSSQSYARFATHVGVVVGEFAGTGELSVGEFAGIGDASVCELAGTGVASMGEFAGSTRVGGDFRELAGVADVTVRRIDWDPVRMRDRHVLRVTVTHLDDGGLELYQLAVRVLKAAPQCSHCVTATW